MSFVFHTLYHNVLNIRYTHSPSDRYIFGIRKTIIKWNLHQWYGNGVEKHVKVFTSYIRMALQKLRVHGITLLQSDREFLRSEYASNLCQALYASLGAFLWLQNSIGVLKPKKKHLERHRVPDTSWKHTPTLKSPFWYQYG